MSRKKSWETDSIEKLLINSDDNSYSIEKIIPKSKKDNWQN